MSIHS